ncbi:ABC transporter substrate-binding protein [Sphingomonas sp.]|uniref:ABC transporter substrate-binding protein n=1 Tax=Sphingomonas sp. TaxID=28214 RepID=UPI003AFFB8C3
MRVAAALSLVVAGCQAPPATRGGIVSVNPCADALLVRLAPERIAAISHYSQDPAASSIPPAVARRYRATAGTAEEVIALRPALVLASSFTLPATRQAYAAAGLRVVYLDSPTTVAASIAQVREVAAVLGERDRGEALAVEIENAFKSSPVREGGAMGNEALAARPLHPGASRRGPPPRAGKELSALLYISGDLANGSGTLLDELLRRAGFRNAAAGYGLTYSGRVPLELLAARPPAVVIAPDEGGRSAVLRRDLLPHVPQASFPRTLVNCGGPAIVPALTRLRAIRASLG